MKLFEVFRVLHGRDLMSGKHQFTFTPTLFEDGAIDDVYFRDIFIGRIAARNDLHFGWCATSDTGISETLRFVSGFKTRMEAAFFLLGAKVERDMPADATHSDGSRVPLGRVYTGSLKKQMAIERPDGTKVFATYN
jgi:hypothetical protein